LSVNNLHIPVSLFLLLTRGSVTAAAVDICGRGWQVASGGDDNGKRKSEDSRSEGNDTYLE